jgi:GNAT superfamily N-acetyltransferase
MIEFRPIECSLSVYNQYEKLFKACFPNSKKYQPSYLEWLYEKNPDGQVIGFDAWDGNELAAHYGCIPAQAEVAGVSVKVLLSLNTATHPAYQGRGLFTNLAELAYRAGNEQGYDAVYGVANANSTPGFIRKLGFQLIEPLSARIGVGRLGINFGKLANQLQFRRIWTDESMAWRCANPINPVAITPHGANTIISARSLGNICTVLAELGDTFAVNSELQILSPLRLFIGLVPTGANNFNYYVDIPKRLRPSPLNLIYRSLSGRVPHISQGSVFFSFIDFDAY